jgi:amidohydrolase
MVDCQYVYLIRGTQLTHHVDGSILPSMVTHPVNVGGPALATLAEQAAALRPRLEAMSRTIHSHPETAFQETFCAAQIGDWLAEAGFAVQRGAGNLPTAFVGRLGSGAPTLAMLLEYDALPGIGHACGHNLISAGGVTAARLIAAALQPGSGTLKVIGTPAEEGGGGKVRLLDAGVFQGIDAVLMFHPADRTLPWRHAIAAAHLRVQFHGLATHAAKTPEVGRSALAAVTLFFTAVDALRQFIPEQARIHGVIRQGGLAPNVVPDFTEADLFVRDLTQERTLALVERVTDCAKGAALCTGTRAVIEHTAPLYTERKNNHAMAERVAGYLRAQGIAVERPSFANPVGSSDVGNVSLRLPTIQPYLQIADRGTASHSEAFREAALSSRAHDAALRMAVALARTALDLFGEPGFLAAVQTEFSTRGADVPGSVPDEDGTA